MIAARRARFLLVGLLMLTFALALTSAVQKSPTADEQNHIARGAAYLGTGDPRLSVEHPPLVNVLSALPAHLLLDLQLPLDEWWEAGEWYHFADNFLWHANSHPDRIVFLARLPIIGLGLILATLVFRWADERFGPWGGLLAAAFCALDPNVLAHTRLSTTDMGGTCFIFLAAYALRRAARLDVQPPKARPRIFWTRLLGSGLAFGLALSAKLSSLLFIPIFSLILLIDALISERDRLAELKRHAALLGFTVLFGLLVVWATYGLQIGRLTEGSPLVPTPSYLQGIRAILNFSAGGRPAYLLGRYNQHGWWYYFPVAFAVKTPLATLLALIFSTLAACMSIPPAVGCRLQRNDVWLLLPPLLYFLASMTSSLNIGYRHLLPMLPFLAVHIARLTQLTNLPIYQFTNTLHRLLPIALAIWLAVSTIAIYPHFLATFNLIGGGPEKGWRVLADSNVDWGQDLLGLRRWMAQEGIEQVRLAWFGSAYPEAYDISYDPLPGVGFPSHFELWSDPPFDPQDPEPGIYVISVNNLLGLNLPDPDLYAWFRARPPDAKIGYSLFVYEVRADA